MDGESDSYPNYPVLLLQSTNHPPVHFSKPAYQCAGVHHSMYCASFMAVFYHKKGFGTKRMLMNPSEVRHTDIAAVMSCSASLANHLTWSVEALHHPVYQVTSFTPPTCDIAITHSLMNMHEKNHQMFQI